MGQKAHHRAIVVDMIICTVGGGVAGIAALLFTMFIAIVQGSGLFQVIDVSTDKAGASVVLFMLFFTSSAIGGFLGFLGSLLAERE